VCSDSLPVSGPRRVLHQSLRGACSGTSDSEVHWQQPRPVSHTLVKSARREQPQCTILAQMRTSAQAEAQLACSPVGSHSAGLVAAPSAECGQPRHAWSDEAAKRLKSYQKPIQLSECGRAWAERSQIRHGDRAEWKGGAHAAQSRSQLLGRRTANQFKCRWGKHTCRKCNYQETKAQNACACCTLMEIRSLSP
jgi:hypothetical protein